MAIDKKLIFWKKQSTFNAPSSPTDTTGSVLWYSIVFFKDTGKIWTNGTYYNCTDDWESITNKPSTFTPSEHNHDGLMPFVAGTQLATTGSWTGIASSVDALYDGLTINYWLPYSGSGNATLNLTLKGGGTTGAINCYYSGATRLTTHYAAGNIIKLTYRINANVNGTAYTGWWADANYDTVDNYTHRYYGAFKMGSAAVAANNIIGSGADGLMVNVMTTPFKPHEPIYWTGSAYSANQAVTYGNVYESHFSCSISGTGVTSLVMYQPIYLKGTVNNGLFTTNSITQTTPTTDDGFYYIFIGYPWNTTNSIGFSFKNWLGVYKNGAFRIFSGYSELTGKLANSVNITVGDSTKSFDGASALAFTLAEIGAAAINQTMYIGTTAVPINRSSGVLSLAGVSIDGNAATATTSTQIAKTIGITDANSAYSDGFLKYYAQVTSPFTNQFPTANNANGILWVSTHPGSYGHQLGFSSNGEIYRRTNTGTAWTSWKTILDSGNSNLSTVDWSAKNLNISGLSTSPKILINKVSNVASGISWYSSSYTAWQDYMANSGTSGNGINGNITAPSGTLVTGWGKRSFIENNAGFGWTFESGTNSSTTPSVVAEIRSSDGAAKFNGIVTSAGFTRIGSDNTYVLLGGGSHKLISDFTASLVTSTTTNGTSNVVTGNTNTYLNVVQGGTSTGSSTQITGTGSVTISSDATGKLTINGDLNADTLDSYHAKGNGGGNEAWGYIPIVGTDGTMQVGRYLDFNHSSGIGVDYNARLHTNGVTDGELYINSNKIWHAGNLNLSTYFTYRGSFTSSSNMNDVTDMGMWLNTTGNGSGNNNFPAQYGYIQTFSRGVENYSRWQMSVDNTADNIHIRAEWAGVWGGWKKLWHSANDGSGSGLDADLLDGLHNTSFLRCDSATANNPTNGNFAIGTDSTHNFIQSHAGKPLHLNELGNYVYINNVLAATINSNVASATKLANTRYIWGQPFNGEGDVTGEITADRIKTVSESHMSFGTYTDPAIGIGAALKVSGGFAAGGNSYFTGGNVLINTLTDSGYKLDVNGTFRAVGEVISNSSIATSAASYAIGYFGNIACTWGNAGGYPTLFSSASDRWIMHINPHISYIQNGVGGYTGSLTGARVRFAGDTAANSWWDLGIGVNGVGTDKFSIGRSSSPFISIDNTGNFGIGTTSPSSYKLDVNGNGRFTGALTANGVITAGSGCRFGAPDSSNSNKYGLSFRSDWSATNPWAGVYFGSTVDSGTHGSVTGNGAVYFTVDDTANRGWIFRQNFTGVEQNVASISNTGNMTLNGYLQVQGGSSVPGIKSSYYGNIGMYFGDKLQYQSTSGIKEFIMTTRLYNINPANPSYAQYNRVPVILWHGRVTITSSAVSFLMYNSGGIYLTGSRISTGTATVTMNAQSGALVPTAYTEYMVVATGLGTANTTGSTAFVTIPDTYKYANNFRIVIADDNTANDGYAEIMIIKVMDPAYYTS